MKIRAKLLVSFSIIAALTTLAFAAITYRTFSKSIEAHRELVLSMGLKGVLHHLGAALERHRRDVAIFSTTYHLDSFVEHQDEAAAADLLAQFSLYLALSKSLSSIALIDPEGLPIVASARSGRLGQDYAAVARFWRQRSEQSTRVWVDERSKAVLLTYPVLAGTPPSRRAILVFQIDVPKLQGMIEELLPAGNGFCVVSKNGRALFTAAPGGSPVKSSIIAQVGGAGAAVGATAGRPAHSGVATGAGDFQVLSAYVAEPGWTVSYAIPDSFFANELSELKNHVITASIAIMWISIWVVLIVAYRLSRRITLLSRASRDMISFDYTTPLDFADSHDELGELAESFEIMRRKIKDLVITDPLTGLYNRRFLMLSLCNETARAERTGGELCCLMLDIDHFKKINDTYGHQCGDEVLKQLGKVLQQSLRQYDIVARYGGEEFVVILPGINIEQAFAIAERMRKDIATCAVTCEEAGEIRFTVSIGVSSLPRLAGNAIHMLIRDADTAFYQAKNAGRNRTAVSAGLTSAHPQRAH